MSELSVLKNIGPNGHRLFVNAGNRTARVTFRTREKADCFGRTESSEKCAIHSRRRTRLQRTETESGGSGDAAFAGHSHAVKISPWLPSPGDYVLCIYLPTEDGDGFVIGGI